MLWNMELIIKKSQCIKSQKDVRVKSPKEAIRKTLRNYLIKDGFIVRAYETPFSSTNQLMLREALSNRLSVRAIAN